MTEPYRLSNETIKDTLEIIKYLLCNFNHKDSKQIYTARYFYAINDDLSLYYKLEDEINYSVFHQLNGLLLTVGIYKGKLHTIFYGEKSLYIPVCEELTEDFYFNESVTVDFHNISLDYMKKATELYNIILRESYD